MTLKKILEALLRFRMLTVTIVLAVFFLSFWYYQKNYDNFDNSLPVWLNHDDPDYKFYRETFLKEFESDRVLAIAFKVPDAFGKEELVFAQNLSRRLNELAVVRRVQSLVDYEHLQGQSDAIVSQKLFDSVPPEVSERERRAQIALSDDNVKDILVPQDRSATVFYLTIDDKDISVPFSKKVLNEVKAVIHSENKKNYPYHISGNTAVDVEFERISSQDQKKFLGIIFVVIFLVTYLFFRNFFVAFIPLLIQGITVVVTVALFYLFGFSMNLVTAIMGPILVAVCVADSVHMMLAYYENLRHSSSSQEALFLAVDQIRWPCFFTALTTFAGFIAFNASPIEPNKIMGIFAAFGVMLAYVLTILFIPLVLTYCQRFMGSVAEVVSDGWVQKILDKSHDWVIGHTRLMLIATGIVSVVSIYGMSLIKIETNTIEYFPKSEGIRQDIDYFENELSGVGAVEIVLEAEEKGRELATDPKVLKAMEQFENSIKHDALARKAVSFTDYLKKLNRAFHENHPEYEVIPETQEQIAQLLLILESSGATEMDRFRTLDNSKVRMSLRTLWKSSEVMNRYIEDIQKRGTLMFEPLGITFKATGAGPLWIKIDSAILESEIFSFTVASLMITVMMILVLKNVRAGLITMIPNLFPIAVATGLMGYFDISLNVSTVMTASVAIGLTVDDSIHYLIAFKKNMQKYQDTLKALHETNRTVGSAIVFTTIVLIFGFGVLMTSQFLPSRMFGVVMVGTLAISIVSEIILMPLLLKTLNPFKVK